MDATTATDINSLIAQLVLERSVVLTKGQQQRSSLALSLKQKHWATLANEPIYLLKLTVKVGAQSLRLDGSHLGIRDDVLRLLEESAKGGYAANISLRLKEAANKLQARQKTIYNRYTVLSEPFRFVHESSLPKALEAIEEMVAEADMLREEILKAYSEEYAGFLEWAYRLLSYAVLEPDEIELALRQYADAYPTREELEENSLLVLVEGPVKVPSLIEEAHREEAELAHLASKRIAQIEREKLTLLARAQATLQETLISTMYDAQVRSRDEAHGKLAELLESFSFEGADATQRKGQKWDTLISRLEVLAQYDSTLEPIVQKAVQIQQLYLAPTPELEAVQWLMEDFRAMLKERVKQDASGVAGVGAVSLTKALALDSGYSQLLKQLDAIALHPDPEQLRELKGSLAAMENLFKFRTKDLQKRWNKAENAVRQSLGLELTSKPQTVANNSDSSAWQAGAVPTTPDPQPYDPEAGF